MSKTVPFLILSALLYGLSIWIDQTHYVDYVFPSFSKEHAETYRVTDALLKDMNIERQEFEFHLKDYESHLAELVYQQTQSQSDDDENAYRFYRQFLNDVNKDMNVKKSVDMDLQRVRYILMKSKRVGSKGS